jgi:tripeptidyl-peptidase-1
MTFFVRYLVYFPFLYLIHFSTCKGKLIAVVFVVLLIVSLDSVLREINRFNHGSFAPHPYYVSTQKRSRPNIVHTVRLAVQLKNLDIIEGALKNVSDPSHAYYGQHWSREKIGSFVRDNQGVKQIEAYFNRKAAENTDEALEIIEKSHLHEIYVIQGKLSAWEKVLSTKFYQFQHIHTGEIIHRALEYSLPEEINRYVYCLFDVIDYPRNVQKRSILTPLSTSMSETTTSTKTSPVHLEATDIYPGYVSPALLNSVYSIQNNTGTMESTHGIFACLGQKLSLADLTNFQSIHHLPLQGISRKVNGNILTGLCGSNLDACSESNLDFQYLMAIAQKTYTVSIYGGAQCDFVYYLANLIDPPSVISISYGWLEDQSSSNYLYLFNYVTMVYGLMGNTVLVASGDDGAAGHDARNNATKCAYRADFPGAAPYILSVGATQVGLFYSSFSLLI